MIRVVVVGAGGLGAEIADTVRVLAASGSHKLAGFLDDREDPPTGFDVLGAIDPGNIPEDHVVIIGIGDPVLRYSIQKRLGGQVQYVSICHPTALVSSQASIGSGTYLAPYTYVGPNATIEDHVVMNIYASIGHDATVGRFVTLSPYATLNGSASAGLGAFLGTRAGIDVNVSVGQWSKVSASTFANKDCDEGTLVAGNPPQYRVMFRPPE